MPKLRTLSASDLVRIFSVFDFIVASQKGSHIKLQRIHVLGRQTLTIPNHSELDKGTVRAIFRQSLRYISESDLYPYFYSE